MIENEAILQRLAGLLPQIKRWWQAPIGSEEEAAALDEMLLILDLLKTLA